MSRMKSAIAAWGCLLGAAATAQELPPLAAYGRLPEYGLYQLSPSGKLAAARVVKGGRDMLAIVDVDKREFVTAADATRVNPRGIEFVEEDKVVLDFNHPLAGQALHFEIKVLGIE